MTELSFARSIMIQAPAEKIYPYIGDLTRHTEWNHQPQKIEQVTPGPVQVGSIYRADEGTPRNVPTMQKNHDTVYAAIYEGVYGGSWQY